MPKGKLTVSQRLTSYANELGDGVLTTDGSVLYCNACNKSVAAETKSHVEQHLQTEKHMQKMQKRKRQKQPVISPAVTPTSSTTDNTRQFHYDLTEALLSSDIPLWKLQNLAFKNFLSKYIPLHDIPNELVLRKKYVPILYQRTIQHIRETIGEKNVYLIVDESTDGMNQHLCNVLIGPLSHDKFIPPMLLDCVVLDSTNSSTISQSINNALMLLWPSSVYYDRVFLLLTDAAPYMIKAGAGLSVLYPKMIYITCLLNAIHRVAEVVRFSYAEVDDLFVTVKQLFSKAPSRRRAFLDLTSLNTLPPSPSSGRWGTWIEAACFFQEHYAKVKRFVMELDENTPTIQRAKSALRKPNIAADLAAICTHFKPLVDAIAQLEEQGLRLTNAVDIVTSLNHSLEYGGRITASASQKMSYVLSKNPGWSRIMSLARVLSGVSTELPCNISPNVTNCFNFAPITSFGTERSFSEFKYFFRSNGNLFTQEHLMQHMVVLFNNKRFSPN
ncbi:hypothetical protein AHF37_08355 [Paragonimus kellicotti]|nr:hypothetical protein AHF37_08355 [Paragonimus kellicotti]